MSWRTINSAAVTRIGTRAPAEKPAIVNQPVERLLTVCRRSPMAIVPAKTNPI